MHLEPTLCNKRSHRSKDAVHCHEDPVQPKFNLKNRVLKSAVTGRLLLMSPGLPSMPAGQTSDKISPQDFMVFFMMSKWEGSFNLWSLLPPGMPINHLEVHKPLKPRSPFLNLLQKILLKYSWFTMLGLISAEQKRDSVIHKYIFFSYFFHYGLSQDIEYSSLCCTVGPCCSSILYIIFLYNILYIYIYYNLHLLTPDSSPSPSPLVTTSMSSVFVNLFLFPDVLILCYILDSTCKWYWMVCVFLFLTYFTKYDHL